MLYIMKIKNNFFIIILLILVFSAASCSKNKQIDFCEGASTDGKGMNCGTVFAYGDVTAIIKSKEPFGSETISVDIKFKEGNKFVKAEALEVNVKPDDTQTILNIPLYKKGIYEITAHKGDKIFAVENVEIAE
jgi:hypothetical protein